MIDTTKLTPRNATIVGALVAAAQDPANESGQLTVDSLRRKCQTTKANIVEALMELEAFPEIEFDSDSQVAMIDMDAEFDDIENLPDPGYQHPDDADPIFSAHADAAITENDDDEDDEDDEDEAEAKFRFPAKHKAIYEENGGHCGDALAEALTAHLNYSFETPRKDGKGSKTTKGIDLDACEQTAEANGIAWHTVKGNNNGQVRMNLSNMLRAKWRKGQDIKVGEATVKGLANYKTRKQWCAEYAAMYQQETGEKSAATAMAIAEQEFEAKAAGGEYRPDLGTFVD